METHSKHNLLINYSNQPENRSTIISDILEEIESDDNSIFSYVNTEIEPKINLPLSHLLISIKDNISLTDIEFTANSEILSYFDSSYTATAVQNLMNEGIGVIGKTKLDEFAIGTLGQSSTINPLDKEYMIGGSSSGAAAAVAKDYCHVSICSDTGGSARIPAAMTGAFGFKPSYGSVSRSGLLSFAPEFDQISYISKSLDKIKEVYKHSRGKDLKDMTSVSHEDLSFRGHTIGVLDLKKDPHMSSEVIDNYNNYIDFLMDLGFMISEVEIPTTEEIIAAYLVLSSVQSASNLSRFTGLTYGNNLNSIEQNRSNLIGNQVKERILFGNYLLTQDTENSIIKAEALKNRLINTFKSIFSEVDVFLSPTTPLQPLKRNETSNNTHFYDAFTCIANLIGSPALSFIYGSYTCGLPQSIQIISPKYTDLCLLDFYKEIE